MADVSVITLPDGSSYNLKDSSARNTANAALPKAGGTMSGDILFSDVGTGVRQIRFTSGASDYARVAAGATATNSGWMEIATADDAVEPIYARQYSGTFTTLKRTATLLDASGNTAFPGTVKIGSGVTLSYDSTNKCLNFVFS